ncbi:MAG: hypothetical protein PHT83_03275 [Bacilli bacterium]|nr:hypothetical protein [Bacilli bacterium]
MDSKDNKKKETKKQEEELKKDLEDLVENFKKDDPKAPKVRVISIGMKNNFFKNPYLDALFLMFLNLFFILALAGIYKFFGFDWIDFSHYIFVILFVLIFSINELILKILIFKYMFKLVLLTLGVVLLIVSITAFVLALIITPNLDVISEVGIITFMISFLIIRSFIKNMLTSHKFNIQSINKGE